MHLFLLTVLGFCVISVIGNEHKDRERVASLIVLPPIVLGYDELYDDLNAKKPTKKSPEKPKEIKRETSPGQSEKPVGFKRMNVPWDQLVAYDDPRGEDAIIIPQQRLVLKRTKDGKIVVPDKEWTLPEEITSQVKNVGRMTKQDKNGHKSDCKHYKREGNNKDRNDKNETSSNVEEKTTVSVDTGKEELIRENANITKEEVGKVEPSITNVNNQKLLSNKIDVNNKINVKNIKNENVINEIDEKTVIAEKITNIPTPVEIEDHTVETEPIHKLMKKKNTHIALPGNGVISDPLSGDILNFQGNFVLPNKLFDCPCAKNKS